MKRDDQGKKVYAYAANKIKGPKLKPVLFDIISKDSVDSNKYWSNNLKGS